jgi:hypothetical protein
MAGTTTNYAWTYPTSTDLVKDGATAIQTAIQGADTTLFTALGFNYPGLRLVKKQAIGTSVTSVTITNAFSATYDAYKVIVAGATTTGSDYGYIKFGAAASNYAIGVFGQNYSAATQSSANVASGSSATYMWYIDGNQVSCNIDIINPFLTEYTVYTSALAGTSSTLSGGGVHKTASSYTDLVMGLNGGTAMTDGTIYVYGYGKS